jgi:serine/threonine protein kinase
MSSAEVAKIGMWDEQILRKALRHIPDGSAARDLLKRLLHHDPTKRISSMRQVLEHQFFAQGTDGSGNGREHLEPTQTFSSLQSDNSRQSGSGNQQSDPFGGNHAFDADFAEFSDGPKIRFSNSNSSDRENGEFGQGRSGSSQGAKSGFDGARQQPSRAFGQSRNQAF